ncbi:hypothetical protein DL93DRAFT_1571220 [Clavulina sp. PMI_390]|nr:hypothetical protein DL93DRAFT_1571220 [Clavulina sp. PMI_390]
MFPFSYSALSGLLLATAVAAHGLVSTIDVDGTTYQGYPAFNPVNNPQRIIRAMYNNGPITDVASLAIACNGKNEPAALVANVTAGSFITYTWGSWPKGHTGPITNYMASCGDDCRTFNASNGNWFKIDETGYDSSTKLWATDKLFTNSLKYSVMIPQGIPSGQYLVRHEILALHATNAPQYYPSCIQVQVNGGTGSLSSIASSDFTTFPGAYNPSDPGYKFNIYYPPYTSYPIEGPQPIYAASNLANSTSPSNSMNPTNSTTPTTSSLLPSSTSSDTPGSSPSVRFCRPLKLGPG